jgi:hypothetical protein
MAWSPSEYMDREIRDWMKSMGWEVTHTQYGARSRVYAWRHESHVGGSPTLRISRDVLESFPPFVVVLHLDRLRVAAAIHRPQFRLVVVQQGTAVVLAER